MKKLREWLNARRDRRNAYHERQSAIEGLSRLDHLDGVK